MSNLEILHNKLNTKKLLFKMKILEIDKCVYCKNILQSTFHALIEYPDELLRQIELRLRTHINRNINISKEVKIFGMNIYQSPSAFIVNMAILHTKIVIYKYRQDGSNMRLVVSMI